METKIPDTLDNLRQQLNSLPFLYCKVKVIPKSSLTEVSEIMADGTIKIRVKCAPEKGRANEELIKFLSQELQIPRSNIQIISGKTEREKLLKISH